MDPLDPSIRDRVLAAIDGGRLSGFETLGRLEVDSQAPGAESFLYPALHRLEADGRLQAAWPPNQSGTVRRRYSRRRR
jgi:DNA-binding PadR family transcriptional regulator